MASQFKVGKWIVSPHLCEINDGQMTIRLEPKSMELLQLLAQANGELVSRKQIMEVVWKDRVVTEYALNNLISGLRKHLNVAGEAEAYITTRPKLGYQLIAKVENLESAEGATDIGQTSQETKIDSEIAHHATSHATSHAVDKPEHKTTTSKENALAWTKQRIRFAIALVLLVVTLLVVLKWQDNEDNEHEAPVQVELTPSIVVLPFDVFDSDEELAYFADGLAEEIIHQLTVVPNLKVISRTSSFYFRDKDLPLTEIAKTLDVSYVLEGSVRKVEDSMRVTLQLIQANDDTHVWSKVFTATQANSFSIQHEISTEVAHSIDSSFVEIPQNARIYTPASSEAYLRLLKGRKLNQKGTPDAHIQARDEFLMATLLEPNYADAYVDLGMSYLMLIQQNKLTKADALKHAQEAIDRALELNPDLAPAFAARGVLHQMNSNVSDAQTAFKRALEINPDLYLALINYANFFRKFSRYDSALKYYEKAKSVAPLSGAAQWGLGNVLLRMGRISDSINQYQNCISLLTDHVNCHYGYAYALRLADRTKEADEVLEKINKIANKNDFWFSSVSAFHMLWQGKFEAAEARYESLVQQYGLNNDFVLSIPILKAKLGQSASWAASLAELVKPDAKPRPNVSVHASYAIAAYYDGQCDVTISRLEKILEHRAFMFDELEHLTTVIHYSAMLAHCYQKQNNKAGFDKAFSLSDKLIQRIPENEEKIGAFIFARAQHAILKGNVNQAMQYIEQLHTMDWQLIWLIELDPILQSIGGTDIASVK